MATFTFNGTPLSAKTGLSLFDLAGEHAVKVDSSCKKQGICKECMIEVRSGEAFLSPLTENEKHLAHGYRLSCQAILQKEGDVVANSLKRADIRIKEKGHVNIADFKIDPAVKRAGKTIFLDNKPIAQNTRKFLGLTVDIGTTTVVARLIDLENGIILETASFENPQRYAGSNVMSRIAYDTEVGKKELKRILTRRLSNTLSLFKENPENIFEIVVGGNTTMRDIFFGMSVHSLGQKPYESVTEKELREKRRTSTVLVKNAQEIKLPVHPKARIYGLPVIGGHIGADTSAGLLAINLMEEEKTVVFMDIGTNTEIVIGNKYRAIAASSPSGPSFEGGGIVCGMPALKGAIERVDIDEKGKVKIETIGNIDPVGICGSGLIDLLGELRKHGMINEFGRFNDEREIFWLDKQHQIFINENDINLLAQTKAANIAALKILKKIYGIALDEIDVFYMAGGFGSHINIDACIRIGLLPDIPKEKFKKIGNATIEGLGIALLSNPKRKQLEEFIKNIEQVSLESDPDFFDFFVDGCLFQQIE